MQPILCNITSLPAGIENRSKFVREAVKAALDNELDPDDLPLVGLDRASISFDPVTAQRLMNMAKTRDISPGRLAGMLLSASLKFDAATGYTVPLKPSSMLSRQDFSSLRQDQLRLLLAVEPQLDNGQISLAEAGTGVGKSRVIARIAHRRFTKGVVIIAAPTVHTLTHLLSEWIIDQKSPELATDPRARVGLALGRSQFVDFEAAFQVLSELEEDNKHAAEQAGAEIHPQDKLNQVLVWLVNGCPTGHCGDSRLMAQIDPGLSHLAADLLAIYEDFPLADCTLDASSSPQAQQPWLRLKSEMVNANIVFCTHAMLAIDNLSRTRSRETSILPDRALVLIDEAHDFERIQAEIASDGLSLSALRMHLRPFVPAKTLGLINECMSALQRLPGDVVLPMDLEIDAHVAAIWPDICQTFSRLYLDLKSKEGRLAKKEMSGKARFTYNLALRFLARITGASSAGIIKVSFSPQRKWPTLQIGPRFVMNVLNTMWDGTAAAALFSATLYLPGDKGVSASHIRYLLAIPPARCGLIEPIQPEWLTATPVLHLADRENIGMFCPPSGKKVQPEQIRDWLVGLVSLMSHIVTTAKGGTLVLMSSYDRAATLGTILNEAFEDRLIVQSAKNPLMSCRSQFIERSQQGERPIWIATGSAWTGLDLRDSRFGDDEAHLDNLVTDLVIPNLPFGLNRSTTHTARVERGGLQLEALGAALLLRQGLGRLIRRQGLQNRRMWVLDGRVFMQRYIYITKPAVAVLGSYAQRKGVRMEF